MEHISVGVCMHTCVEESKHTSKSYVRFLQFTSYVGATYEEFKRFTNETPQGFGFFSAGLRNYNERLGWSL